MTRQASVSFAVHLTPGHKEECAVNDPAEVTARAWATLEDHFKHHARLVNHFRHVEPAAVVRMCTSRANESGEPLSQFERDALVERHCELFGTWPE
jgi:hypothetical protein